MLKVGIATLHELRRDDTTPFFETTLSKEAHSLAVVNGAHAQTAAEQGPALIFAQPAYFCYILRLLWEKVSVCLSVCLSVYLSICLFVYLSICLSVYLSIYLSIYL